MKYFLAILLLSIALSQTVVTSPAPAPAPQDKPCPSTTPKQNEALILEYYNLVINQTNFDILDKYISDTFIQHNPWAPDGKEGLRKYLKPLVEGAGTKGTLHILRSIAADDYVWTHSKVLMNGKQNILFGIFRIECGLLQEHWDAVQEVIPSTLNDHAYF